MGSRGPLRKPTNLKIVDGNSAGRTVQSTSEVSPEIKVPNAPKYIQGAALNEWRRITPILKDLKIISLLDRAALAQYCQAYGRLHDLEMAFIGKINAVILRQDVEHCEAVRIVSTTITPSGYEQQSVIVQLINRQNEQVNRTLGHFGLSPAQRSRVQPSNSLQQSLPGMEEKKGFNQFG